MRKCGGKGTRRDLLQLHARHRVVRLKNDRPVRHGLVEEQHALALEDTYEVTTAQCHVCEVRMASRYRIGYLGARFASAEGTVRWRVM